MSNVHFIDTHCHLDFPDANAPWQDPEEQIATAREANVKVLINVGCDLKSSLSGLALALKHEEVWCTFGVHPNEAQNWNEGVKQSFHENLKADSKRDRSKIVGIGEIGLDYFRNGASKEVQETAFQEQLQMAKAYNKPVVIHCRDAFDDALRLLEEEKIKSVAFHCFSGDLEIAKRIWDRGWITSFAAVVSYPKNDELRAVAKTCPKELYFLETDAPFLPHQDFRGQRNRPAYIPKLAETLAAIREQTIEEIGADSSRNAENFFRIA